MNHCEEILNALDEYREIINVQDVYIKRGRKMIRDLSGANNSKHQSMVPDLSIKIKTEDSSVVPAFRSNNFIFFWRYRLEEKKYSSENQISLNKKNIF